MFHCQEKLVSIVSCRRCLSWQNVTIQWKLGHGAWVILFRSPRGSGRLCNTCRFPGWVVGCYLSLIVLYRVWCLHLRVLQCLILPDVDMRLEQRIPHVCSLLYCWGAAVLHVQTQLLWVSSGTVTQLRQVGMGMAVSCSWEVQHWARAPFHCNLSNKPEFGSL